jgi:MFS family permease
MVKRPLAMAGLTATVAVAFGSLFYAFSVLITAEAAGADFSTTVLSVGYGGMVLIGGALAFAVGRFVDRHGVRPVIALGATLGMAGMLGLAASTRPWQVIAVSWLLLGPAGGMTFYEPAFVAINQWYPPAEQGRALGLLTVVGGLAGPIFLPLTAALVAGFGWRTTAVVLALTTGLVGLGAAAFVLPTHSVSQHHSGTPGHISPSRILGDSRFAWYTISVLLTYAAFQTVLFHRIALWEQAGLVVGVVSFWAGISGWLSFPGRYLGPVLARGKNGVRWNAAVSTALAITVIPLIAPTGRGVMILHFIFFGLVFGAVLPMRAAVMGTWFNGPNYGRIMGIQWTMAAFAGAAGPLLAGVSRDAVGSYRPAMAVTFVCLVAAGGCILLAGRAARNTSAQVSSH